jgi:hypothetical protein
MALARGGGREVLLSASGLSKKLWRLEHLLPRLHAGTV